jgi:membrane protein required for colicin V production
MIWIDFVIIGIVFIYMIKGLFRGFNLEFFILIFWLTATAVGLSFSREFSVFLDHAISNPVAKIAASFTILFLITLIIGSLIRILLGTLINKPKLTFLEFLGGMILGVAHGMFLVVILILLAGLTPLPEDSWWKESTLLPPFQIGALWLRDHIPSALAEHIHYR